MSALTVNAHILIAGAVDPMYLTSLNAWIVAHPLVATAFAAGALAVEVGFVVAVFVRWTRVPTMIGAILFHAGLWITIGFRFLNLPHLLLFLDLPDRRVPSGTETS